MTKRRHRKDPCPTEPRYFTAIFCPWHGPRNEQMKWSTKYVVFVVVGLGDWDRLGILMDLGDFVDQTSCPLVEKTRMHTVPVVDQVVFVPLFGCVSLLRVEVSNRNSASSQRTVAPEGCRSAFRVIWNSSMSFCSRVLWVSSLIPSLYLCFASASDPVPATRLEGWMPFHVHLWEPLQRRWENSSIQVICKTRTGFLRFLC